MKKNISYFILKRLFDILSSLIAILLLSWLIIILLIINAFATKGAPMYVDLRVGKNGKPLKLLKFRSMYKDANTRPEKYLNAEQLEQFKRERKVTNDPRITGFGKFLRKTSLDELPQLFCIFIGSMSVVGPRPIIKDELETNYTEEQIRILLSARPGLISNWGVNGRNLVKYDNGKRQNLELEYFNKRSLWYDLKLIFKAVGAVLGRKGAQ